jgi:hypothetical protein
MSIASEITRLQTAKADLKTAIEGKGVTVPASAKLDAYPALVESIQQGGGGDDDNWYLVIPNAYIRYVYGKTNDTTWTMENSYVINMYSTGIYFEYKGEKYYVTDIIYGNNPLSKTGQPLANIPTATGNFDRATITKDASGNFTAYFRQD